jgi:hypothetical protein
MISGAIAPGTELISHVVINDVCQKCHARFWTADVRTPKLNAEWCGACNDDITHDMSEDAYWSSARHKPHVFMGWRFRITEMPDSLQPHVLLMKRLPYPERPGLELSYHIGYPGRPEYSCAWLIAHWWEHALRICPCQNGIHDDQKGSRFREQMIESLLWYADRGRLMDEDKRR